VAADSRAGKGSEVSHLSGVASEHHVALAGIDSSASVGTVRANEDVVHAVAIDIPRGTHREPRVVEFSDAAEHETRAAIATGGWKQLRELEEGREIPRLSAATRGARRRAAEESWSLAFAW
jgi:hypothetical protein